MAQVRELRDLRGEKRVEEEGATPFDVTVLDTEISAQFLDGVIERNGITLPIDLHGALKNKKLVISTHQTETLTLAAVVALARAPHEIIPGARLRFLRFEGTDEQVGGERNVVRDRWFEGPIPRIVTEFAAFMRTQVRELEYLGPDGTIVRENEYPEAAWQEAVVNALVHRSYALAEVTTFVRMFDDRIEVESPGGFPGANRPDADGVFNYSAPRNPLLANTLQYLRLVWMAREGTRRMHDAMQRMGLPVPEFRDPGAAKVVVVLHNDLARRRPRQASAAARQRWDEVASQLGQDLVYFQRLALDEWAALVGQTLPPDHVLKLAEARLRDNRVELEVKERILDLFSSLPDDILKPIVVRLTPDLLHDLFRDQPALIGRAVPRIGRFDETVETVLDFLERAPLRKDLSPIDQQRIDQLVAVLNVRLSRKPVPTRQWVDRVVAVTGRIGGESAAYIYRQLTGKPPG